MDSPHICLPESCPPGRYFVTAVDAGNTHFIAGPYTEHSAALADVQKALKIADKSLLMNNTVTNFDRAAMPTNLLTVNEWRTLARNSGAASWKASVRAWVRRRGGAMVLRADGRLQVWTLRGEKISQRTYKPGQWAWESNGTLSLMGRITC